MIRTRSITDKHLRVWPQLEKVVPLSSRAQQLVTMRIAASRRLINIPSDYTGPSVQCMVATLTSHTLRSLGCLSTQSIMEAVNFCWKLDIPDSFDPVLERISLHSTAKVSRIDFVALLCALRSWTARRRQTRYYVKVARAIMTFWVNKLLGTPPESNDDLAARMAALSKSDWQCSRPGCSHCTQAREFLLKADTESQKVFQYISHDAVEHIKSTLETNASRVVAWTRTTRLQRYYDSEYALEVRHPDQA